MNNVKLQVKSNKFINQIYFHSPLKGSGLIQISSRQFSMHFV